MPSFLKKFIILFIGAVLVGGTVGAITASAVTTTGKHGVGLTFKGGPGHPGTVFAGTWDNGRLGFCIDFGAATPNRTGTTVLPTNVPGMSTEESNQAKYIANKYSTTRSPDDAANAALAIWRLQNDRAFNVWYGAARSKGVITVARYMAVVAINANAVQHGRYKMTLRTTEVLVGQTGRGTVQVLGSNGKPAVGRLVTLTAGNAKILTVNGVVGTKGTTQSTGVVFTYLRTGIGTGKVGFQAALTAPSSAMAQLSTSTAGHQRTLSGGYGENVTPVYSSYELNINGPSISGVCDSDCDGVATVTFRYANRAGQAIKWVERVGNVVVAVVNAQPGTTGTAVAHIADGKVITTSTYCYTGNVLGGWCKTASVQVKTPYEIVCPAWAQGELNLPCNCTPDAPASVTLTSPAGSPRFYLGFVIVNNGAAVYQANLVNGQPASINTGKLPSGTNVVIGFRAYRNAARTVPLGQGEILQRLTVN